MMAVERETANIRRGLVHQRGCGAGPEPCTCEPPFPLGRDDAADLIERLVADLGAVRRWVDAGGVVSMKRWSEDAEDVAKDASIALSRLVTSTEYGSTQDGDR